jgi:hypothetical protein
MENHKPFTIVPHQQCFEMATIKSDLPMSLLVAVARGESNFDANAASTANAIGVMQIQWPGTAKHLGIDDKSMLQDPCINILAGARYLKELYAKYKNWHYALAAYNYGPTAIKSGKRLPEGAEWYSRYIQDHFQEIMLNGANITNSNMETLVTFKQPYRARGYIYWMREQFPNQEYSWFQLGRGSQKFVVIRNIKEEEMEQPSKKEISRSPAL